MTIELLVACALVFCGSSSPSVGGADDSLDGTWIPSSADLGGKAFPDEVRKSIKLEIKGDAYTVTVGTQPDRGLCKLDPSAKPKSLDITGNDGPNKGKTIPAIYTRNGDTLRVCYNLGGNDRPAEFKTTEGTTLFLVEYQLQAP